MNIDNESDINLIATLEGLGYLPNGFQGGHCFRLFVLFVTAKSIVLLDLFGISRANYAKRKHKHILKQSIQGNYSRPARRMRRI